MLESILIAYFLTPLNRWDAQWPTQMFEKGYGLETRTGGWRFYRIREDKKEADEEATLQAIMKSQESSVTKEQVYYSHFAKSAPRSFEPCLTPIISILVGIAD
jgi:hypothetical protein